jgi:heat shock protein HslJ
VDETALLGTWAIDATFDSPEQPFVAFLDGGAWVASDGCNRVQGTWVLGDQGALTTTAGPSTLMACDGAQLPLAIAQADFVQLSDDILTITSSADSTVTTLIRSTDPNVGPQDLPVGQWVESDAPDAAYLTLAADGTVSGSDGCNRLVGGWTVADDGAVEFGALASTLMACEGVETWLGGASTGRIQGGVMTIQDATGEVIGQLSSN